MKYVLGLLLSIIYLAIVDLVIYINTDHDLMIAVPWSKIKRNIFVSGFV